MIKKMKLSIAVSTIALALFTGCGYDNEDENIVGATELVVTADTFTPIVDLTKEQLQAGFDYAAAATNTTASQALLGIKSYKINYMTKDDNGKEVRSSGLVTVPALSPEFLKAYQENLIPGLDNPKHSGFTLSIVSDQHGTIFEDAESPTHAASNTSPNKLSTLYSGAALFMTIQPDYIGFDDSNESHPFILEQSLANSTVDMIKAAIAFANKAGLPINGQVFLSGYSEGGYATLSAAKEIQENHPEINLKAVAPMAGPYDMETLGELSIQSPVMSYPPYLAYVVHAYSEVYSDVDEKEIITATYQPMLSTLFDTEHNSTAIYLSLPNVLTGGAEGQNTDKLFTESILNNYETSTLKTRFTENSPIDWAPQMPMKLLHCTNDHIIPYAMSESAHAAFMQNGADASIVELVPIEGVDANATLHETVHGNCAIAAYGQVIPWFVSIRRGD